jgi:hypothetical protein
VTHRRLAAPALAIFAIVLASPAVAVAASPSPSVSAPSSASPSPAPASPTTYAAVNVSLVVSSGSVTAGGHVTVSGSGFEANEPVDLSVSYSSQPKAAGSVEKSGYVIETAGFVRQQQPTQVGADGAGTFSHDIVLSQAGMATITATGTVSQRSSSSTVNVLSHAAAGAAASQTPSKPQKTLFSGTMLMLLAAIPLVLLIAFGVFTVLRRRQTDGGVHPVAHEPFAMG